MTDHHCVPKVAVARHLLAAVLVAAVAVPAYGGIGDLPTPSFPGGKASVPVLLLSGVVKRSRMQTDVICTSLASGPVDIGVEFFAADGTLLNEIGRGTGVLRDVSPGDTVTIGTSGSAGYLEDIVTPIIGVAQGSARVLASSPAVSCTAVILDDALSPPAAIGEFGPGFLPGPGPGLSGRTLPRFSTGRLASHASLVPGVVTRGRLQTDFFCTSLASAPIDVGIELFDADGLLLNDIPSGNGSFPNLAPGETVTIGTTGTAAVLETVVLVTSGVSQGLARILSTSPDLLCSAMTLDAATAPPLSMSSLRGFGAAAGSLPSPTPTATATATSTPMLTPTPTQTETPMIAGTATPTPTITKTATPIIGCTGDCGGDGEVTVDELLTGVSIALGNRPASDCTPFDSNSDGVVTVDEIVRAVNIALSGCVAS